MEEAIRIILLSGKSALDLALYTLLPVLVVMMALMKLAEARGLLALVARMLEPILRIFGVPGAGAFAMLQLLLVSFAAPVATFSVMERDGTHRRAIAATLAMVFTMSQANVVFPMVAAGLNLPAIMMTSVVGGLAAAAVTYYFLARSVAVEKSVHADAPAPAPEKKKSSSFNLMISGGQEAVQVIIGAIPILILAIFLVNVLKAVGGIAMLERALTPLFGMIGFPAVAVLPLATKYLAGGTAMMGVTLDLVKQGAITTVELNRMAGFLTNPCDIIGVAVLSAAGTRCSSVVRPAVFGAAFGILLRGVLHLLLF